jgi:hypothetical protein
MLVEWVIRGPMGRSCLGAIIARRAALIRKSAGEAIPSWDVDAVSRGGMCCGLVLSRLRES